MASYEDLVPGELWEGDYCAVDDSETGRVKVVAVEEPRELHSSITIEELNKRPELVWDEEKNGFVFAGSNDSDLQVFHDDGQEN